MEETKKCGKCKEVKPRSEFALNRSKKDGLQSYCKTCKKEYDHDEYQRNAKTQVDNNRERRHRQRDWFNEYKKTLKCGYCGLKAKWWCLTFHHLVGDDKCDDVSNMVRSCSQKTIMDEVEKCVCLCFNCHTDLHYYEKNDEQKHEHMMKKIMGV